MEIQVTIVDFGQMSEAIQRYHQIAKRIEQVIDMYLAIMKALQAAQVFTGSAATAMIAAINTYVQALKQALANLNQVIDALQKKLDTYQQAHTNANNIASGVQQAVWADV